MLCFYRLLAYVYFVFSRIVTLFHCTVPLCNNETHVRDGHCQKSTRLRQQNGWNRELVLHWHHSYNFQWWRSPARERRYVLLTDNAEHEARDVSTPDVAIDLTKQMTEDEHINACKQDYAVSLFINDVSSSLCPSLTVEYTRMFKCLFTVVFVRRMCMIF